MPAVSEIQEHQEPRFLSEILDQVQEPGAPFISPRRFAEFMRINQARLADLTRVHRNTVSRKPDSEKVQSSLRAVIMLITAAAEVTGDLSKAVYWFLYQPLADYRHKTPAQLVTEGHVDAVRAYIEDAKSGNYG